MDSWEKFDELKEWRNIRIFVSALLMNLCSAVVFVLCCCVCALLLYLAREKNLDYYDRDLSSVRFIRSVCSAHYRREWLGAGISFWTVQCRCQRNCHITISQYCIIRNILCCYKWKYSPGEKKVYSSLLIITFNHHI